LRKLVTIANEQYVRNLVQAGAFAGIEDEETYWVTGGIRLELPVDRGQHVGAVVMDKERRDEYTRLRQLMLMSYRDRSDTQRIKLEMRPSAERQELARKATRWRVRQEVRRTLKRIGPNPQLAQIIDDVKPDVVIAPSGGVDALVYDVVRSARAAGVFSLALIFNWDNLSSKGAFPVRPDHLAVVGPQSVDHAWKIHRYPRDRVSVLGGPYIDSHFHHELGSTRSPFPFRYVLFAGCLMPFDELTPLLQLDQLIEDEGLDVKVVYRPHPQRRPRKRDDRIDERGFRHVVIDPQVREAYLKNYGTSADWSRPLPALDYYPKLLENAEFVICPLSTMVLESAIFERRVLVIAYHDGIHRDSPGVVIGYDHFQGMDNMPGLEMCHEQEDLVPLFRTLAGSPLPAASRMRDAIAPWVYHDERTYSERLADLLAELAERYGLGDGRVLRPRPVEISD
jgi:hypothetical protein